MLSRSNPDMSHQISPIKLTHCSMEHVTNLTNNLLNCQICIGSMYPMCSTFIYSIYINYTICAIQRLIVYALACAMYSSNNTKYAKISDLLTVLESWNTWDNISSLANHQTVRDHLMTFLMSISEMDGASYHDSDVSFQHTHDMKLKNSSFEDNSHGLNPCTQH